MVFCSPRGLLAFSKIFYYSRKRLDSYRFEGLTCEWFLQQVLFHCVPTFPFIDGSVLTVRLYFRSGSDASCATPCRRANRCLPPPPYEQLRAVTDNAR